MRNCIVRYSLQLKFSLWPLLMLIMGILDFSAACAQSADAGSSGWPIIRRKGDQLYEGDRLFRFFGLAAPNIQQNESQIRPDRGNRFPDEYEIRDAFSGMARVGGRATRCFSLSVYSPSDSGIPVYIPARRTYNEEAFRCLDRVLALAKEYDVRVIIPFIASQRFGGIRGVDEFAALSGKEGGAFWTDPSVKEDYKHFLHFILNRKNTVSGILYRNDPAILAWQLGNEFGSYAGDRKLDYELWTPRIEAWCREMSAYIKSIDPNHLLMEAGGVRRSFVLDDPNIDLVSEHLYEYWNRMGGKPWELAPIALAAADETRGIKPLVVDEFGLGSTDNLQALMKAIREGQIAGGLLWGLRSHRRDGGWFYHNEGGTPVNSYHVPGFSVGHGYDETRILDILRREAYAIRGMELPQMEKPSPAPVLMRLGDGFTWRGSAGASAYTLERAEHRSGPFRVIAMGLEDAVIADVAKFEYSPEAALPQVLYYDELRKAGVTYFYRLKASNAAGETAYSALLEVRWQ